MNTNNQLKFIDENKNIQYKDFITLTSNLNTNEDLEISEELNRMNTLKKSDFLSTPIKQNIFFRGKIKYTHYNEKNIYQYYNNNYSLFLMTGVKTGRKNYKIYLDEQLYHKIGTIKINLLGNIFKIKMNDCLSNNCEVKYVNFIYLKISFFRI